MHKTNFKLASICLILATILFACKKDSENPDYASIAVCTDTTLTYTNQVAAILNANCATSGCHNTTSAQSGINLATYANAKTNFQTNSDVLASVHHGSGVDAMPQNLPQLPDTVINKLDCWVKNSCLQ